MPHHRRSDPARLADTELVVLAGSGHNFAPVEGPTIRRRLWPVA